MNFALTGDLMKSGSLERSISIIIASHDTRIRILGACYLNKTLKINRPYAESELQQITGIKNDEELKRHIETLSQAGLISVSRRELPKMSEHDVVEITEKGIKILNDLGINENYLKEKYSS